MIIALLVTIADFIIDYLIFSYQRGTLYIARSIMPDGNVKSLANIQAKYSPTWLGVLAYLNYGSLAFALFLLWQIAWWYAVGYLLIRLILIGLLPTFDKQWARYIENKYHNVKR